VQLPVMMEMMEVLLNRQLHILTLLDASSLIIKTAEDGYMKHLTTFSPQRDSRKTEVISLKCSEVSTRDQKTILSIKQVILRMQDRRLLLMRKSAEFKLQLKHPRRRVHRRLPRKMPQLRKRRKMRASHSGLLPSVNLTS